MNSYRPRKKRKGSAPAIFITLVFLLVYAFLNWRELEQMPAFVMQVFLTLLNLILPFDLPVSTSMEGIRAFMILTYHGLVAVILWFVSFWLLAPFLLPIKNRVERGMVVNRLFNYSIGWHGPAVFVREGNIISEENELKRHGPGVAFVDPCSAIVVEEIRYTGFEYLLNKVVKRPAASIEIRAKALGPGLHFLRSGNVPDNEWDRNDEWENAIHRRARYAREEIRGVVDLRKQVRVRSSIHAYTRDSIELKGNIVTVFTLGQAPDTISVGFVRCRPAPQGGMIYPDSKGLPPSQVELTWEIGPGFTWEDVRILQFEDQASTNPYGERVTTKTVRILDDLDEQDKKEIFNTYQRGMLNFRGETKPQSFNGKGPFVFDATRVVQAVYGASRDMVGESVASWTDLPGEIATQIMRNLISQKTYDELFYEEYPKKDGGAPKEPGGSERSKNRGNFLAEFKKELAKRMRAQGVMNYRFVIPEKGAGFLLEYSGDETDLSGLAGKPVPLCFPFRESDEVSFRGSKVLRQRGIKVIHAGFTGIRPVNQYVGEQYLEYWKANWEKKGKIARGNTDREAMHIRDIARAQAQQEMTTSLSNIFQTSPHSQEALAMRVFQAMETVAGDPEIRKLLPRDMMNLLWSLGRWLNIDRDESASSQEYPHLIDGHPAGSPGAVPPDFEGGYGWSTDDSEGDPRQP